MLQNKNLLKQHIQKLLINNQDGMSIPQIEDVMIMNSRRLSNIKVPLLNKDIKAILFELVISGIAIQKNNLFMVDNHRLELSEDLICTVCAKKGTLVDITAPYIFCYTCGNGYHAKCIIQNIFKPHALLNRGWLCKACKICQICYMSSEAEISSCNRCDKGFHKSCVYKALKTVCDQTLCDSCNMDIQNLRSYKRPLQPVTIQPSPKLQLRDKKVEKKSIGRQSRLNVSDLADVSRQKASDLLQKLLNSQKFPDITADDIKVYQKVQSIVASKIPCIKSDEISACTPPYIQLGKYEIKSWYSSPFPQEYATIQKLHICEFCLEYRKTQEVMTRHLINCQARHPPDREIYRSGNLSIFEIDGQNFKNYCQNLCLIAKLFLDHKTLYYDVEPFLFYVLTLNDNFGSHLVGYFSKEKYSPQKYNVSCITTLPPYQRAGYGRFLIDFSYLLTREEGITGSPEKPLSALGRISYYAYWACTLCEYLQSKKGERIAIRDIMQSTGMDSTDITSTLQRLGMLKFNNERKFIIFYKGNIVERHLSSKSYTNRIHLDAFKLHWSPFIKPSIHTEPIIEQTKIPSK